MERLKGKVAIVTGGARGIGQAIASTFAREGAQVIAVDIQELSYQENHVKGYILDVTNRIDCKTFFDEIIKEYGRIDILVNNAGITRDSLVAKMSDEQWDQVIDVDLNSLFNLVRYIGPHMEQNGVGSIINISSASGEFGNIGQSNYSAAKSAMFGLTKTWAKEFARKGAQVRVNAITPGFILTDIIKSVPEAILKKSAEETMLKRLGEPQEVANVVLFLASEESSYITGHILSVNGGMRL